MRRSGWRQTKFCNNASNAREAEILENEAALSCEMTRRMVRPGAMEILPMKEVRAKVQREVGPEEGRSKKREVREVQEEANTNPSKTTKIGR